MSRQELDPPTYTTREFLKLMASGVLAPSAAAAFLAACRPKAGAPAETAAADPQPTDIPIAVRALMPQELITATQEAAKPKPESLPTADNIKIVREFLNPCQTEQVLGSASIWGGWLVKLDHNGYYLKKGSFTLEKRTPSGSPIGSPVEVTSRMLPAGTDFFIPTATNIGQLYQTGGGSRLGSVNLKMGKMEWSKVDDSPKEYSFRVNLPENPFSYERIGVFTNSPLALKMTIGFENTGDLAIGNVGALAIAVDGDGNLQDILSSGDTLGLSGGRVSYGQKLGINLRSALVNIWGQTYSFTCAPLPFSESSRITYWIYFTTRTGMPVVHQDTVVLAA